MATTARRKTTTKTTTERGLGWKHQQAAAGLRRRHQDGSPCAWCGRPMHLADERNWDYDPDIVGSGHLQADHSGMTRAEAVRLGVPIPPPDRLLHKLCNGQRGAGINDHLAFANRQASEAEPLAMGWPW